MYDASDGRGGGGGGSDQDDSGPVPMMFASRGSRQEEEQSKASTYKWRALYCKLCGLRGAWVCARTHTHACDGCFRSASGVAADDERAARGGGRNGGGKRGSQRWRQEGTCCRLLSMRRARWSCARNLLLQPPPPACFQRPPAFCARARVRLHILRACFCVRVRAVGACVRAVGRACV
jgi:hypothetical protein